jgi:transposase
MQKACRVAEVCSVHPFSSPTFPRCLHAQNAALKMWGRTRRFASGPQALAVALIQTPHRFRSKRQLWTYSGRGLETRDSGEYRFVKGQPRRRKKQATIRGLNKDYNHDLKGLFKGAATRASVKPGPFQEFYQRSLAKGIKPTKVRLTLARKIAAITLTLWKKGEDFDIHKLNSQAA